MSDPVNNMAADDLPDDDPDVIAGMHRLAELRELEGQVTDLPMLPRSGDGSDRA